MFGLSHPEVCRLIQELPGAELCKNFRPELSFSRFGPQVVARPIGEESSLLLHSDTAYGGEMDRVLGRRATLPSSDFEMDEGGSGRDEIPLALWHVKAVEPRRGKTLLRSPASQHHANQSTEFDEGEEENEEENDEDNNEDNNEDGESTDDDDL